MHPLPRHAHAIAATIVRRTTVALLVVAQFGPARAHAHAPLDPATAIHVPDGFRVESIAHVAGPRELAVAANGDLFVGTSGSTIVVIANAQSTPGPPATFTHVDDHPVAGITIAGDTMYLGAQFGVYALPFAAGERTARTPPRKIATLRPSGIARGHRTTTVAVAHGVLYASVASSCNTCDPEIDPMRASIQQMHLDGSAVAPRAQRIRNPIALTVNPQTGALWAGVAGQDELAHGHPYEIIDDISAHPGVADYGWPVCYENRRPVDATRDCSNVAVPRVVVPAYETPVGAVFYPVEARGRFAFPASYEGGLFVTLHGSWHAPPVPPRVVFIPMRGDEPGTPVDWNDPTRQWQEFSGGFQRADGSRSGRPTGIAVGTDGSLFVADDASGTIYRIRPSRNEKLSGVRSSTARTRPSESKMLGPAPIEDGPIATHATDGQHDRPAKRGAS